MYQHFVLLFLQVLPLLYSRGSSQVVLKDNGYEGLTVIIKDNVPETGLNKIDNIQKRFTNASAFLFTATNRRAYFRNITIVIPRSWTNTPISETVSSVSIFAEHVRLERFNSSIKLPSVRGNLECGQPGWYMRLDPLWLFRRTVDDGPHDKVLVHEWGHLRWGLFDEYASVNHPNALNPGHKIYFDTIDQQGNPKPVACTSGIQGFARKDIDDQETECSATEARNDPECKFFPVVNQPEIKASIMSHQYLSGVTSFCDKEGEFNTHDSSSQNLQNDICNGRSAWEVMRLHEDFKDGNNPPIPESQSVDTTPTFRIVQETGKSRVFVFDVSGSMQGDKIVQQAEAAYLTIDTVIQPGSCLGIVKFSSAAQILAPMTMVQNTTSKQQLKDSVPTFATGGTQIYLGLLKGIEVIESAAPPCSSSTQGAEIILLSDGESNGPYLEEISPSLISKEIIVHTVAITNAADADMVELARRTQGRSFTYLQTQTVSFADALSEALTTTDLSSFAPEKILSETVNISANESTSGTLRLEEGLGDQTVFTVEIGSYASVTLTVTSPSGNVTRQTSTTRNMVVEIPGIAETGLYRYNLTTKSQSGVQAVVSIFSSPISADVEIVRATSRLSSDTMDFSNRDGIKLFVQVEKGANPVLNANVSAILDAGPSFDPIRLKLEDTGRGADSRKNDGVYSAYLVKRYFTVDSRYNIKVTVTNSDNSVVYTEAINTGGAEAAILPNVLSSITYTPEPVPSFQRQSIPPLISVANFVANPPDTTPPARITDLTVLNKWENRVAGDLNSSTITFNITWTAVGDDMTVGIASVYEMQFDQNITAVRKEFESTIPAPVNLTTPLASGQTEYFNLTLSQAQCNTTCYIAVRARDTTGLLSDVSNIVPIEVFFPEEPTPSVMPSDHYEQKSAVMIGVSVVIAAIFLLSVITVLCFILKERRLLAAKKRRSSSQERSNSRLRV